jgi:hypothetical protein
MHEYIRLEEQISIFLNNIEYISNINLNIYLSSSVISSDVSFTEWGHHPEEFHNRFS